MKIPDDLLRQYFELATDLTTEEINTIMMGDIREAHMLFAKELIKMYDDINEYEKVKERYLQVAKGSIPEDIEEFYISENEINICELLIRINFANSKGEAKRMIQGNGIKINSNLENDINKIIKIQNGLVIQFGKNKFKKIVKD